MIPNFILNFFKIFKKEESAGERMERWEKEKAEMQRLNELHEKASKNKTRKIKSKPVNYNF